MKSLKEWLKPGEREIDILGEKWQLKVQTEPKIIKGLPQSGECCWQEKYIYVWLSGDMQRDLDTLIHELCHACRMSMGVEARFDSGHPDKDYDSDKRTHDIINPIAFGLGYVLAHNK